MVTIRNVLTFSRFSMGNIEMFCLDSEPERELPFVFSQWNCLKKIPVFKLDSILHKCIENL